MPPRANRRSAVPTNPVSPNRRRQFQTESLPALRKHLGMKALEQVVTELVEIPGDKNFRDSIERLVHALRMVSDR